MTVRTFDADLRYSLESSDEPFWDAVYRKAFVNFKSSEIVSRKDWQLLGIDRIINLTSGQRIKVDEKKRRVEYGDFALEFLGNDKTGSPGWVCKDLAIDFLAYAFMQSRRVYLLQWNLLRAAWRSKGETWKSSYRIISSNNPTYKTLSVAVPIGVVLESIQSHCIINV